MTIQSILMTRGDNFLLLEIFTSKVGAAFAAPMLTTFNYLIRLIRSVILMPTSGVPLKPVPGFIALKCAVTAA